LENFLDVDAAIDALASRLEPVSTQELPLCQAAGRWLAEAILLDRDSPACDCSAMDGYAVRLDDLVGLAGRSLPVSGTVLAGRPPVVLPLGTACRVMTGAPVPAGAEAVIRREDVLEQADSVQLRVPAETIRQGENIRRRGENATAGQRLLEVGQRLGPQQLALIASVGRDRLQTYRPVRVAVATTGDELAEAGGEIENWQIRDSNGPLLESWLAGAGWVQCVDRRALADQPDAIKASVTSLLAEVDCLLLTGGVSAGDADYVPDALRRCGVEILFHRLPLRPGKPVLGGVGPEGQLVLGLPGNPVSVAATATRVAQPLLWRLGAGWPCQRSSPDGPKVSLGPCPLLSRQAAVELEAISQRSLPLLWLRPATWLPGGRVRLGQTQGSGDWVSLGRSDGCIEIPPDCIGRGPFRWWPWELQ